MYFFLDLMHTIKPNFSGVEIVEQEYRMKVPNYEKYKDLLQTQLSQK